ncbi:hypothetical protein [Clostridium intestinale]|uniref:hypothetical protein n=1 Tax=Clostridium intestinale TaxID=36845 RepID=UPI002DD6A128|nr:hypothetical protein [Clostridium intestinale]WRY50407.1 hypothetical protein P8F83_17200 [Clostridium intestinale]
MLKLLKYNFKEVRWFYFWEIVIVTLMASFMIWNSKGTINENGVSYKVGMGVNEYRNMLVLFSTYIMIIHLGFNIVITNIQLSDRKSKLLFLTDISGKKFILSKIIEFSIVQLLTSILGLIISLRLIVISNELWRVLSEVLNYISLFDYSLIIYIVLLISIILIRTKLNGVLSSSLLGIGITILTMYVLFKFNFHILQDLNFGTISIKMEKFVYSVGKMLNMGQGIFGWRIKINVFSALPKLGILAGTFILASKAIDKKLDVV